MGETTVGVEWCDEVQGLTWITTHDATINYRGTVRVRTVAVVVSKANRLATVEVNVFCCGD